ncbi:hypothetical protein HZH66_002262 [Vespula vulgaris]|uniref:Uncharacterized protein n=2 Tax=Vespula vulgaris TaxID=7454 RepID=A0A834KJD0_VESVU|nr:hypothetical protein HZH66_002262 [Vespula vulgaris]
MLGRMTRKANFQGELVVILALLTACVTIVQSTKTREEKIDIAVGNRERRHVGVVEVSSDRGERSTDIPDVRVFNKSVTSSKSNEISSETGRKVSHRLIGGHLRDDRWKKRRDEKGDEDMLASSAGNGKETRSSLRSDDDDERKTLSQQVKEGKYGLIQNEIYEEENPRRPGIISYLDNPEVPKDNIENLGGLDEDEIWLAENHLLVLKGGNFPGRSPTNRPIYSSDKNKQKWPPIDDYQAPKRQVKIPSKPKVPPPFPVQLKDGGPIQIIGVNGSTEIENATLDRTMDPFYGKGILPGDGPFFTITSNGTIVVPDFDYPANSTADDVQGSIVPNDDGKNIKSEEPPIFYHAIPPGAVFVPPPSNRSDYDDEDQSIYYPPPYSFYYPQDNTTAVPPGPLVPGIILPPPPDFFSPLEEKKTTTKKYTKRPSTSMLPKSRPTYLPPRKLTTRKQWESTTIVPKISTTQLPRTRIYIPPMLKNLTGTPVTRIRPSTVPYAEVTTVTPEIQSTLRNTKYYGVNSLVGNGMTETPNTEDKLQTWPRSTNGKSLPVVNYYASTTPPTPVDESVEVTPAAIKNVITTDQPVQLPNRASYYFYEESNDGNVASTVESAPVYYQTTTESPYYKVEPLSQQPRDEKPYYSVETHPPKDTSRDYNVKLIDTLVDNPQVFQYRGSEDSSTSTKYDTTLNRDQGEGLFADQAPIYYQTITARPPVTIQRSYYTTPKSSRYYQESEERVQLGNRQDTISKPIYQYSFEIADYSKRGQGQRPYYRQQNERVTYDYQTVKSNNQRYDYDTDRPNNVPYKIQGPIYPSTTGRPTLNVTPNPQHAYFTRQEERLLDDVTKEYFTIFGKKINGKETPSTTPIYNKASHVTERPNYDVNRYVSNNYNVPPEITYRDQVYYDHDAPPPNLESDTRVNYRRPLPPINPDSEFVEVFDPKERGQPYVQQRPTISLKDDTLVNYRNPRPPINPDAEFIHPISISNQGPVNTDKSSAYFAYRLPGDGGHFYFLTPQAIRQEQNGGGDNGDSSDIDDDDGGGGGGGGGNGGYYYPKPRGPKLLRRRRNPGDV